MDKAKIISIIIALTFAALCFVQGGSASGGSYGSSTCGNLSSTCAFGPTIAAPTETPTSVIVIGPCIADALTDSA
jgi:hypothetical protein